MIYKGYTPLEYAKKACDTLMKKFDAVDLPPKGRFHYHQGVFLSGMEACYLQSGEEKYYEYIKKWVDSIIDKSGTVTNFDNTELDDLQSGNLLFLLLEKTGDERYSIALDQLVPLLKNWKCNDSGGFWHKECLENQMWLDGLYMAGPIAVRYGNLTGDLSYHSLITKQAFLMDENNKDKATGLYKHGWDYSKKAAWADPVTGQSPEFWGRAIGWYAVAVLELLDLLPEDNSDRMRLTQIAVDLLNILVKYQDNDNGLWYQVINRADDKNNWTEVSCSCLFIYALSKAIRLNVIDESFLKYVEKGFKGVVDTLKYADDGDVIINKICIGTGIRDYDFYINRPTSENDLHGAGAFVLMCCEVNKILN